MKNTKLEEVKRISPYNLPKVHKELKKVRSKGKKKTKTTTYDSGQVFGTEDWWDLDY